MRPSTLQPFGPSTAHFASLRVHNSAWSFRIARKLACGSPCLIGLTPRCFAHRARASCAPRGFSRFAASDFAPTLNSAWSFRVFAPPCASLARCSASAERFALSSTLQPFGPSTAHFASLRVLGASAASRPPISHRPALRLRGVPCLRTALAFGGLCSAPADFASLRVLGASAASRPPISRCARRSSAQRLPCARGAVGVSRLRGCRLRGCRLRGCRFHRFRFGLRPSGINQCARIAIWHIHDIASAPYALRSGARLVHQDPHRLSLLRPAPRGKTLRPPPARRLQSSDTDSRSGWS